MHKDDVLLFSGFVGLFNLLLLWPLFFLFHYSKWELFEWPTRHQWTFLLLNGLVGTVLSEVLWLWYIIIDSYPCKIVLLVILLSVIKVWLLLDKDYSSYTSVLCSLIENQYLLTQRKMSHDISHLWFC